MVLDLLESMLALQELGQLTQLVFTQQKMLELEQLQKMDAATTKIKTQGRSSLVIAFLALLLQLILLLRKVKNHIKNQDGILESDLEIYSS